MAVVERKKQKKRTIQTLEGLRSILKDQKESGLSQADFEKKKNFGVGLISYYKKREKKLSGTTKTKRNSASYSVGKKKKIGSSTLSLKMGEVKLTIEGQVENSKLVEILKILGD